MTVNQLAQALRLRVIAGEGGLGQDVDGCYIGDLLSWVMSRLEEKNAWITVMGNVNAVAVAKLAEASCIVLCEGAHLDADAKAQADANAVPVLAGEDTAYALATAFAALSGTRQ